MSVTGSGGKKINYGNIDMSLLYEFCKDTFSLSGLQAQSVNVVHLSLQDSTGTSHGGSSHSFQNICIRNFGEILASPNNVVPSEAKKET